MLDHPLHALNERIEVFRKIVPGFRDNGRFELVMNFYKGGLRAPRIVDSSDKDVIKRIFRVFLEDLGKPYYTGHVVFILRNGELTDTFDLFPGSGRLDRDFKEGDRYVVWTDVIGDDEDSFELYSFVKKEELVHS